MGGGVAEGQRNAGATGGRGAGLASGVWSQLHETRKARAGPKMESPDGGTVGGDLRYVHYVVGSSGCRLSVAFHCCCGALNCALRRVGEHIL